MYTSWSIILFNYQGHEQAEAGVQIGVLNELPSLCCGRAAFGRATDGRSSRQLPAAKWRRRRRQLRLEGRRLEMAGLGSSRSVAAAVVAVAAAVVAVAAAVVAVAAATMLLSTDGINCPGDPNWHIFKDHCYLWSSTLIASWEKALNVCRAYRGTELLYLDTIEEKNWFTTAATGVYWTGLNDRAAESDFHWTTNDSLNVSLIPYFTKDLQRGDLKDCVQLDTTSGLLTDIECSVENYFVCKSMKDMDWFERKQRMGLTLKPPYVFPSKNNLTAAKHECLQLGRACTGILETWIPKMFYLLDASAIFIFNLDTAIYIPAVCVSQFPGPKCGQEDRLCNCIGIVNTSFSEVCGISVQRCQDLCARKKDGTDCSKCIPICPDNAEDVLSGEEASIIMLAKAKIFGGASILSDNDQDYLDGFKVFYGKT
ncbi:uncharacterized protein LOC144608449 [Rhinoraja longicauda]